MSKVGGRFIPRSFIALVIAVIAVPTVYAQPQAIIDLNAGAKIAITCTACHGPQGNSVNPIWPNIAGQNQKYLMNQLVDYQQGVTGRENPIMQAVASALSAQDIINVAAYFSLQKLPAPRNLRYSELGRQMYRGGIRMQAIPACAACHDPHGLGNAQAGIPVLAGQQAAYIVVELTAYKNGTRHTDKDGIMRTIAERMTPEEIQAVASYIEVLR